ncbi:MAG: oxygenase MpaB family protein [Candidatus Binatia bacterium]
MPSQSDHSKRITSGQFFSPDSKIWQVDREMALLLAGGRALLLQLAHPKVAAGVAAHSRFQENPLARLQRTMNTMWSIVFDNTQNARAALLQVTNIHKQVHGLVQPGESVPIGTRYDAQDPELLLWVHATLIDSAIIAYDLFVKPLSADEKSLYYEDSKKLAQLFGIPDPIIPASPADFNAYMMRMVMSDALAVGPMARSLAHEIVYPRPWLLRPAAPLFRVVTAGLLPERLRNAYGLSWNERREKIFRLFAKAVRYSRPLAPRPLRIVPNARSAEKRLRLD